MLDYLLLGGVNPVQTTHQEVEQSERFKPREEVYRDIDAVLGIANRFDPHSGRMVRKSLSDCFVCTDEGYVFSVHEDETRLVHNDGSVVSSELVSERISALVMDARQILGVTVKQVADFTGFSRPSIYNHMKNKEIPSSFEGYDSLENLLARLKEEVGVELGKGLKSILVDGKTLLARFNKKPFNEGDFIVAAKVVAKKLDMREEAVPISIAEQRSVSRVLGKMG